MKKAAYINSVSAYLPNSPIANEEMEDYPDPSCPHAPNVYNDIYL